MSSPNTSFVFNFRVVRSNSKASKKGQKGKTLSFVFFLFVSYFRAELERDDQGRVGVRPPENTVLSSHVMSGISNRNIRPIISSQLLSLRLLSRGGGGEDYNMKRSKNLVVSRREINQGFWSPLDVMKKRYFELSKYLVGSTR